MTPIRKGANPVKIPFAIKTTDRTLAAWFNEVRTCLRQLEARVPTANVGRGNAGAGSKPPLWAAVSQVPDSDPAEWQATITLGYLTYQNAGASAAEQGVTGYIVPTVNGVSLESEDVEPLPLPGVDSWVYLRVKTDSDGVPKFAAEGGPVTIEAFDAAQQSVHHVRPSPSGGEEEGDYFFLILQTEGDGGTPERPRVVRRITGNRELPNQLIEIENLGDQDAEGVRAVYEGYDPGPVDKHKFRSLEQLLERGEALIKPLDTGEQPGDTIPFRSIAERATSPQVRVTASESGGIIEVEGNGYSANLANVRKFAIDVDDGLVTSLTEIAEDGDTFNIKLLNVSVTETAGDTYVTDIGWGTGGERKFYVRGGLLSLVDDGAVVDEYEVISRIEGETFSGDPTNQSGDGFTAAP